MHNHPPVQRGLDETVSALIGAGHEGQSSLSSVLSCYSSQSDSPSLHLTVIDWTSFDHGHVQRLFGELASADGGADLRSFVASSGEPIIPEAFPFESGQARTVHELSLLVQQRDAFRQLVRDRWVRSAGADGRKVDLILCPAAPHLAMPPAGKPRASE